MHAYIFVTDKEDIHKEVNSIFGVNFRLTEFTIEKIADARELVHRTNIAHEPTVYIIRSFHKASPEAQNAFLKRLEEPGENINFVLTTNKEDSILPTILSRCLVKRFGFSRDGADEDFNSFVQMDAPSRLAITAKLNKREDAVEFLNSYIDYLNSNITINKSLVNNLKIADETLARIHANANPTLQMARMCVHI